MLVMTLTIFALAQWTGGQLSPQYDRVSMVILAAAVMMTWSAAWALLACCRAVIGAYLVDSAVLRRAGDGAVRPAISSACAAPAR